MKKFTTLAIMAASLAATPAFAEGRDAFDGFIVGGEAGLQRNKAQITAPGDVQLSERDKGFNVRGFAGYDFQVSDKFVLGGEVGIGRGGPKVKVTEGTASFTVDPGLTFDASARAGFLPTENMLVYGRIGYANAKMDIAATNTAATPSTFSRDKRQGGRLWGIGTEFALSDGLGLRAEYRRTKLGNLKSDQAVIGAYMRF